MTRSIAAAQASHTPAAKLVSPARRVGMLGGSFDPPHLAHRQLAEAAIEQLRLDVLHIMPTGQAWHKTRALTPALHRVAMCELAFEDVMKARVDARETQREGPTYTFDTLTELASEYPSAELFLIIGADQLLAFKRWVRWTDILNMAHLVVAQRPPAMGAQMRDIAPRNTDLSEVAVAHLPLEMPLSTTSATAIRALISAGFPADSDLNNLLSPDVAGYISTHSLYQDPT